LLFDSEKNNVNGLKTFTTTIVDIILLLL